MKQLRKGLICSILVLSGFAGSLCLAENEIQAAGWIYENGFGAFDMTGAKEGWNETDDGWVYIKNGRLQFDTWIEWNGDSYYVDLRGIMQQSKIVERNGKRVLLKDSGRQLRSGWATLSNGNSYYALEDGSLIGRGDAVIDGKIYTFSKTGEWITDQDFHGNGIKLHKEGNVSDEMMQRYASDLDRIPERFAEKIVEVTVTTADLNQRFWTQDVGKIVGLQEDGKIWLNGTLYLPDTLLHESIHAYDRKYYGLNASNILTRSPEFIVAYNQDYASIPFQNDNVKSNEEGFVQAMLLYLKDENACHQQMPHLAAFIQDLFQQNDV